ncbi:MAG: sodium:solute symporter family protein [Myxococcota bacterium]|nr:sodium:solute symporter family protein [Myxococcota bacterium]
MRTLTTLDALIISVYLLVVFLLGLYATKRASRSVDDFFVGNRSLPWWLLGISMAATNYSIDTPLAISKLVLQEGVAGVWFWWAGSLSALLVAFLFSRLWRRAGVITDAEIVELRYGGRSAAALRLFKGFYFGVLFNVVIMAWVFLALHKVLGALTTLPPTPLLIGATCLAFIYTVASGIYGVIVTDLVQYVVATIGALLIAAYAVAHVGGFEALWAALAEAPAGLTRFVGSSTVDGASGEGGALTLPLSVFLTYTLMKWWAHKWADGGGKHIQRMLSARDERHALAATCFFALNAVLVVWPWILTALCAYITFGPLADPELAYPKMMATALPTGVLGLSVACLAGAFMSTIDTHLNLGASYLINDIYRRFLVSDRDESHYVLMARLAMALLLALSVLVSFHIDSVAGAWRFLITFAGGAGVTWIIRWFWWRANAWTEFSAMLASGLIASALQIWAPGLLFSSKMLLTVFGSAMIWLPVTLWTAPVDEATLCRFLQRVRPGTFGWSRQYQALSLEAEPYLGRALIAWFLSVIALFSLNFAIGAALLGEQGLALGLALLSIAVSFVAWPRWVQLAKTSG